MESAFCLRVNNDFIVTAQYTIMFFPIPKNQNFRSEKSCKKIKKIGQKAS